MFMLTKPRTKANQKNWFVTGKNNAGHRNTKEEKCNSEHYAIEWSGAVENSQQLIAHDEQNFNFVNDF